MEEVVTIKLDALAGRGRVLVGKTKFKWDNVRKRLGEARVRALKIAGAEVRRGAQREMANKRPKKTPVLVDLGTVNGDRLIVKVSQPSKSDRVTSWKTSRFPKGFLRSDIQYDYDSATDSVVVGPAKVPKLNRLHEVGGNVKLFFIRTGPPDKVPRKFAGAQFGIYSNRPIGSDAIKLGARKVKARRFMANGLKAAEAKIAPAWRDQIVGP